MSNIEQINTPGMRKGDRYQEFEISITNQFNSLVKEAATPLFTTDASDLWETYLNNLSEDGRQHYNCNCCRHFVERFGNLVVIKDDGTIESALWAENVPEYFKKSVKALRRAVNSAKITGVFVSDEQSLGTSNTGEWGHMNVDLPRGKVNNSRLNTAYQVASAKLEDYRMLNRALQEYSLETVTQAVQILQSETLYRGAKVLGVAEWLKRLHEDRLNHKQNKTIDNITWKYVAIAPAGFCHVKSSMIGTLLEDIAAGLSFESISRRFAEKMDPSVHMRSQVAPSQGNIQQAEKLVEKMGIANSLRRRYASIKEIPYLLWQNKSLKLVKEETKKTGVFGNIEPKKNTVSQSSNLNLPTVVMTWDKFQRTVLPTTSNIEVMVDNPNRFMALVTAADETSENILQWNNPFSWYYHGGIDGEIKKRVEAAGGKYENNEIRCSLIWEGYTDLDIHCITPSGSHIYFGSKRSDYGWLDVDANGGCANTLHPVENIRWENNAPRGNYRFYVHNFRERGTGTTPFTVELEVNGKIYIYNGVAGRTDYREDVFQFNYVKGQQPEIRNVSCTSTDAWNIPMNSFAKVTGITTSPNTWGENKFENSGNHTFFLLENCKDTSEGKGRGFFNETLKSELREIRKTLEAYTQNTPIEGMENASACGLGYSKDSEWNVTLKVTSNGSSRLIKIDRFD